MDFSLICRSCIKELSPWEKENVSIKTIEMFVFCTNIKISESDQLPRQFCNDCTLKIESSYFYITEAQKVDVTLRNMVSRSCTSVIVEPDNYYRNISQDDINSDMSYTLTVPEYNLSNAIINTNENIILVNLENEINELHDEKITEEVNAAAPSIVENKEGQNNLQAEKVDINETKKKVCPICRKAFTSQTWFGKHMQKEHTGLKYSCTQCPKTFTKQSQLSYHQTTHSEERNFACGACAFTKQSQLSYHQTTHSEERNFPCSACGKRFKRRKHLAIHMRSHDDAKPYACDKCTMRFKKRSILKCHMKVHEDDKQYLCSYCGWSFAQAGNLAVHMRRHTGEKPFACGACGFRAAAASSLRRHERRHRGASSHVCPTCRKGFYDASALARHSRTHSGARPFACGRCARSFADSWKRKLHLMRAHHAQLHELRHLTRDGRVVPPPTG